MTIQELTLGHKPLEVYGNTETEITGIELDSRKCSAGAAFVAIRGTQADGHAYIPKAISLGANCIICETLPEAMAENVVYVVYENTADIVGPLATTFYGNPTKKMKLALRLHQSSLRRRACSADPLSPVVPEEESV